MKLKIIYENTLKEKQRYEKEKGEKYTGVEGFVNQLKDLRNKNKLVFVHFTKSIKNDLKIGINPNLKKSATLQSGDPLGIYGYPVYDEYLEHILSIGDAFFANVSNDWIISFMLKDSFRNRILIIDDDGQISSDSGIKEEEIKKYIDELYNNILDKNNLSFINENKIGNLFIEMVKKYFNYNSNKQTKYFIDKKIYGIIHNIGNPHNVLKKDFKEGMFFMRSAIQILSTIKSKYIMDYGKIEINIKEKFNKFIKLISQIEKTNIYNKIVKRYDFLTKSEIAASLFKNFKDVYRNFIKIYEDKNNIFFSYIYKVNYFEQVLNIIIDTIMDNEDSIEDNSIFNEILKISFSLKKDFKKILYINEYYEKSVSVV